MELFAKLFDSLLVLVYHCFDRIVIHESCLMQDEPGARVCFSYKMSLEGCSGMLGIDYQRAGRRTVEPGTNPGVFGGQR